MQPKIIRRGVTLDPESDAIWTQLAKRYEDNRSMALRALLKQTAQWARDRKPEAAQAAVSR